MAELRRAYWRSPIGMLEISGTKKEIRSVCMADNTDSALLKEENDPSVLDDCLRQLKEYFTGKRRSFHSFRLALEGSAFQQRVWEAALNIPYGKTVTYGEIAREIGKPGAARAVGTALNRNPLLIIVPCHRVVGSTAASGGFACGMRTKKWLLDHESNS